MVVTGASSGMGHDAARYLASLGYLVFATVRHADDGERLRASVADPSRVHPLLLDVTDTDAVDAGAGEVARVLDGNGRLAGVFSNAGIAAFTGDLSAERCPLATQQRVMDVNHFGAVRVTQAFLPLLRAGRGTLVVNSALMARTVIPFNAGYAASKCALEGFVDGLRREVAAQGVRVVLIEAAAISTDLEAKQDPDRVPADPLYPAQKALAARFLGMQAARRDDPACSPRRVSELVAHAIQTPRPRPRYRVGGGHRPIALLGALPDGVQDAVFAALVARLARPNPREAPGQADMGQKDQSRAGSGR